MWLRWWLKIRGRNQLRDITTSKLDIFLRNVTTTLTLFFHQLSTSSTDFFFFFFLVFEKKTWEFPSIDLINQCISNFTCWFPTSSNRFSISIMIGWWILSKAWFILIGFFRLFFSSLFFLLLLTSSSAIWMQEIGYSLSSSVSFFFLSMPHSHSFADSLVHPTHYSYYCIKMQICVRERMRSHAREKTREGEREGWRRKKRKNTLL